MHPKGADSMAVFGLSLEEPLGADSMAVFGLSLEEPLVGAQRATSVLLCTNGLRKQSSRLVGPPFLAVKHFSQSSRAMVGREP